MMLRWLQKTGGKPIALMGGGTTRVGDPSGKDETRQHPHASRTSRPTRRACKTVFARFIDFGDGPTDALMPDNAEWLAPLNYIDFLRDVGRHFSVNRMLSHGFGEAPPRARARAVVPRIQLHGPAGLRLRRAVTAATAACCRWAAPTSGATSSTASISAAAWARAQLYALTCAADHHRRPAPRWARPPQGAVWLNAAQLSPYDYWQFWRNTEDDDVGRFLRLFTELPLDEIAPARERSPAPRSTRRRRCWPTRRPRSCMAGRRPTRPPRRRAETFEEGEHRRRSPDDQRAARRAAGRARPAGRSSSAPGSPRRTARCAAPSPTTRSASTTSGSPTRTATVGAGDINADGVVKLSLGKKKHAPRRLPGLQLPVFEDLAGRFPARAPRSGSS